jgi:hypothetical protein
VPDAKGAPRTESTTLDKTPFHENAEHPNDAPTDAHTSVTVATDAEFETGVRTVMSVVLLATRHAVARAALRAGIRFLVADPLRAVALLREGRVNLPEPTTPKVKVGR